MYVGSNCLSKSDLLQVSAALYYKLTYTVTEVHGVRL
jgi:hypothetical protein